MLKKPLHIAHGEIRDASGVRVPATEVDGLLRQVNAFDALLAACEAALPLLDGMGLGAFEGNRRVSDFPTLAAVRAAIAAAKPEPASRPDVSC